MDVPKRRKCSTCNREPPLDQVTCALCVGRTRQDLNTILDEYRDLPLRTYSAHSPGVGEGGRAGVETPLPGGDVLSLRGIGSDGGEATSHVDPHGRPEPSLEKQTDPPSILWRLSRWVWVWGDEHNLLLKPRQPSIDAVGAFLNEHLTWAAQHSPRFPEFKMEVHDLRRYVDIATGSIDVPLVAPVPCPYCHTRLVRPYGPKGLEDNWMCDGCDPPREFTPAQYLQAVKQQHELQRQSE